jgi:hypothetical protein
MHVMFFIGAERTMRIPLFGGAAPWAIRKRSAPRKNIRPALRMRFIDRIFPGGALRAATLAGAAH